LKIRKILLSNRYILVFLEFQKFGITDFFPRIAQHTHLNNQFQVQISICTSLNYPQMS